MRLLTLTFLLAAALATTALAQGAADMAPTGVLRIGVVEAPLATPFFVQRGADGSVAGVTVELGRALGRELGVPVEFRVFPNSGECTDALSSAAVDVSFMPVDAERSARVTFGPPYYALVSTFLVTAASGITSLDGVDRPGVRVAGIANTTTIRAATRSLTQTVPVPARSVEEAVERMRTGQADALALSQDSLALLLPQLPGARILPGGFQQTNIAIAVPPGRPAALAAAAAFMERAKTDGTVRAALQRIGLQAP